MALPDKSNACTLKVPVVLYSRVNITVVVVPDTTMFGIYRQLELLFIRLKRNQPAQFSPGDISAVT